MISARALSAEVFAVPDSTTTPVLSVSTETLTSVEGFSFAISALTLVVITESFTNSRVLPSAAKPAPDTIRPATMQATN